MATALGLEPVGSEEPVRYSRECIGLLADLGKPALLLDALALLARINPASDQVAPLDRLCAQPGQGRGGILAKGQPHRAAHCPVRTLEPFDQHTNLAAVLADADAEPADGSGAAIHYLVSLGPRLERLDAAISECLGHDCPSNLAKWEIPASKPLGNTGQ